jgi:hypothetical protein
MKLKKINKNKKNEIGRILSLWLFHDRKKRKLNGFWPIWRHKLTLLDPKMIFEKASKLTNKLTKISLNG